MSELQDLWLRQVGAKIRNEGGVQIFRSGHNLDYQVVEWRSDQFVNERINFRVNIKSFDPDGPSICLHHFGGLDVLVIDRSGELVSINRDYVELLEISSVDGSSFELYCRFICRSAGFGFGLVNPTSFFAGRDRDEFAFHVLEISICSDDALVATPIIGDCAVSKSSGSLFVAPKLEQLRIVVPVHQGKASWLTELLLSMDRAAIRSNTMVCEVVLLITGPEERWFFRSLCLGLQLSFSVNVLVIRDALHVSGNFGKALQHLSSGVHGGIALFKKTRWLVFFDP